MAAPLTDPDDLDFLDDIGIDREGEHKTISDEDAEGGAWSPIASEIA